MEERQKRQVAYTTSIGDIIQGEYHRMEGWEPNYVKTPFGLKVSRVNLIGTVLGKKENQIELDDSTGIITVRSFEEFTAFVHVNIGDVVMIVGRVREFSGEIYVSPETCSKVTKENFEFRKKEIELLKKIFSEGKIIQEDKEIIVELPKEEKIEEVVQENPAEKILKFIEDKDAGEGVNRQEIISEFGDVGSIFEKLINDGDIFEVKTDVFKVLK